MPPSGSTAVDFLGITVGNRYRIISRLGAGGMGVAYRAWDTQDSVPVVIKMPKKSLLEDATFSERFAREIRMMQGLVHPHVVPILGLGDHDGLPFVAMRFLPGGSLAHRSLRDEEGKLKANPPGMLHLWLPAIAAALDHMHASGILHRDVKPENIFFDSFWGAYLGDFGIAKVVEEGAGFNRDHTLTATSMAIGTQQYMAPEQFTPKAAIDGRIDQYALAVTVYEMLSGERPFRGESSNLIVEILTTPPPSLARRLRGLPASLVAAVERGLSKRPSDRFSSCKEFADMALADVGRMNSELAMARLMCPQCGNILKLGTNAAGKKGKCTKCQAALQVAPDLGALWLLGEYGNQPISGTLGQPDSSQSGNWFKTASISTTNQEWPLLRSRKLLIGGAVAASLIVAIALGAAWAWNRSAARDAALSRAIHEARWGEALEMDPDNVAAHLGRARAKLMSIPPDIDGAFADLDCASQQAPGGKEVKETLAAAHAVRAVTLARLDRLADAAKDLDAAVFGNANPQSLAGARDAIVAGWLARAEAAVGRNDAGAVRVACDAAAKANATEDRVSSLRARGLLIEALTLTAKADVGGAVAKAAEASILDPATVTSAISEPANAPLLQAIVGNHRVNFDAALRSRAWDQAVRISKTAQLIDTSTAQWLQEACSARVSLAVDHAKNDRLVEAEQELKAAVILNTNSEAIVAAREAVATAWLARAEKAITTNDFALVRQACDAAEKASSQTEQVNPLRVRGLLAELASLVASGDSAGAAAKASEAALLDPTAVGGMLEKPTYANVQQAILSSYRKQFDAAIAENDWRAATQLAALSMRLAKGAPDWVAAAVVAHPAELRGLPAELLARLPLTVVYSLPPIRNAIGMELKLIPAGTYIMGDRIEDAGRIEDVMETPHSVTITRPFYIGTCEVTVAQYNRVMGADPGVLIDLPVINVSWEEATEFCKRLSATPEEMEAGAEYGLPTEAEWEYACRAGTTARYSFGDDESALGASAWFANNSGETPLDSKSLWEREDMNSFLAIVERNRCRLHPVAGKQANPWGLYDMHGNVDEWCSDWACDRLGAAPVADPAGPSKGTDRIVRGGSWQSPPQLCRSAARFRLPPSERFGQVGFRVVRSIREHLPQETNVEVLAEPVTTGSVVNHAASAKAILARPPIRNSVGMQLKLIPAGSFVMGNPSGDPEEEIPHRVTLTKPYFIGVHEVTNAQWSRVMGRVPSRFTDDANPVDRVKWISAHRFCLALSALPEELDAARSYRLPTEAEWEYACRAGTLTPFHTGLDLMEKDARFARDELLKPAATVPVGSYPPNPWGLFDMHGNVWEWTSDWFDASYYRQSPGDDPAGPAFGTHHTLRGGSASTMAEECTSSFRGEVIGDSPGRHGESARFAFYGDFGLRVVMTCPELTTQAGRAEGSEFDASRTRLGQQRGGGNSGEQQVTDRLGRAETALGPTKARDTVDLPANPIVVTLDLRKANPRRTKVSNAYIHKELAGGATYWAPKQLGIWSEVEYKISAPFKIGDIQLQDVGVYAWNAHADVNYDPNSQAYLEVSPDGQNWTPVWSTTPARGIEENRMWKDAVLGSEDLFIRGRLYGTRQNNPNVHHVQFLRSHPDANKVPRVSLFPSGETASSHGDVQSHDQVEGD